MNKKNTQILLKEFPGLYRQYYLKPTETCMCWGLDVGNGWFDLIYKLSKDIVKVNPKCEATQVKEKFSGLRFYTDNGNEATWDLVREAEEKSYHICEICGKEGKIRDIKGWLKTLCEEHYKKILKERK